MTKCHRVGSAARDQGHILEHEVVVSPARHGDPANDQKNSSITERFWRQRSAESTPDGIMANDAHN